MKIAVIYAGGKEYLVEEGKKIEVIKSNLNSEGNKVIFDKVLLYADDNNFLLGEPYLENILIEGEVIKEKKKKTIVFKYKPKTRYRKKKGYKNYFYDVKILKINIKNG